MSYFSLYFALLPDLLQCTMTEHINIPELADLIIERTTNTNWVIVYKALSTCHNLMIYGHERFIQYLATRTVVFSLDAFMDKANVQGGFRFISRNIHVDTSAGIWYHRFKLNIHMCPLCVMRKKSTHIIPWNVLPTVFSVKMMCIARLVFSFQRIAHCELRTMHDKHMDFRS